ncbi:MAG TPA: hypothetical protein VKH81_04410 [Candidatus Angelobacter sp.]|nr:hypothetical protein [Candidatus Angelobacter sp.]
MTMDTIGDPTFFLRPARQSFQFVTSSVLLGSDMLMIAILFVRKLGSGSLPLTTALALVFAIFVLAGWWRTVHRCHETISLLLRSREEISSNPTVQPLLRSSAELIQRGLYMTALATIMLLLGFLELIR